MRGPVQGLDPQRTTKTIEIDGQRYECYFSSVLSSRGGVVGIGSGAVQGGLGKSSDKREMTVNGKPAQELYF